MATLNSLISPRLASSSSSSLPSLPLFSVPRSTVRPCSPINKNARLHWQLSSSSAASVPATAVTDPDPAAGSKGEKFDWFAQWYPVALVRDLDKRRPHAKRIMGLDVVVWWDRVAGRWQVFDDSCPHRLAPLSEGRIDQWGRLQCVYHGWCFDGSGGCKYIPQAPEDGPPVHTSRKACAAVYPSIEQHKILWFWASTDPQYTNIVMTEKPPYIEELDDPSYTSMTGVRDFPFGYEVLIENLMDPAHVPYAHRGIMRIPKTLNNRANADREGGTPIDMKIIASSVAGFTAHRNFGFNRFIAPSIFYVSSPPPSENGSASSSDVQENSSLKKQQKHRRMLLIFMCIPVSPGRSRLIYVFPRNFAVWANKIIPRWVIHVGQNLILDSDLYLLHVEERKFAKLGPSNWHKACFVPTKSDAMVIAFRSWLRKYSNGQVDWGTTLSETLLPTPPRDQLMDRYWSHVVQCSSCQFGLNLLKAIKLSLQIVSFASIGIVAAAKQTTLSTFARTAVVSCAVACFIASKWLSRFIYKNFYYHGYDHAFK